MIHQTPQYRVGRREGQTLIIAMFVLFIMLFLGLVFVGLIARNLFFTQRATAVTTADNFSEAGIRYSHEQLLTSPEGADWRPMPDNLPTTMATDPDYEWLRAPDPNTPGDLGGPDGYGSFTRILFDRGRALVRLSYEPYRTDALSRYIKIESVGRVGAFRRNDPTLRSGATGTLVRKKIAYVAIGITDYARFVHNLDRRPEPVDLGVPADIGAMFGGANVNVPMILGDAAGMARWGTGPLVSYGGPMRINGNLKIHGDLRVFLNPDLGDKMVVAGTIQYADASSKGRVFTHYAPGGLNVLDSNDTTFLTYGGLVRDEKRFADSQGYPREVERLEPPIIDQVDAATGRTRYRSLTRESGKWIVGSDGRYFNTGANGYGEGVYVNNEGDVQKDVQEFSGGTSARSDWLRPNSGSPNWQGPYYIPPGCYIQLLPDGFRITRNSKDDSGTWRNPANERTPKHSMRFWLIDDAQNPGQTLIYNEYMTAQTAAPFNGVIFAEGNVRILGVIPVNRQLTVVSGGTIYVEGNIIRPPDPADPQEKSKSLIALLAHDYVALNTTQFVGPALETALNIEPDAQDVIAPYHINVEPLRPLVLRFGMGADPAAYSGDNGRHPRLFIRHSASSRPSYMNLLVNYGFAPANSEYLFSSAAPNAAGFFFAGQQWIPTYGLADAADQVFPRYEQRSFPLLPTPGNFGQYTLSVDGLDNTLTFLSDTQISTPTGNRPYYVSMVAVQPLDIRIDALMYAQQGSFFVIPGPWFNPNPNDRRDRFTNEAARLNNFGAYAEYPFYGEPLDVKIHINGAVSENFTPQMADQQEWMRHWAWIPKEYGASGTHIPTEHEEPGFGQSPYVPNLIVTYDQSFGTANQFGRVFQKGQAPPLAQVLRYDVYGRMLPAAPRLPVSPQIMYFGEVRP